MVPRLEPALEVLVKRGVERPVAELRLRGVGPEHGRQVAGVVLELHVGGAEPGEVAAGARERRPTVPAC